MSAILISTDRTDLEITTTKYPDKKAAQDAMLEEILNMGYESEEDLMEDAYNDLAGYSDDGAWIENPTFDTMVWKIIEV